MFNEQNISDYRLQKLLQNFLLQQNQKTKSKIPNLLKCGTGVLKLGGAFGEPGVFILKNKESRTKMWGTLTCRSAWACPHCTASVMAKKATDIACLIDALKTWENRQAVMITFTIPHIKTMSCQQTFTILQDTWRLFSREVKRKTKNYTLKLDVDETNHRGGIACGKKGEIKTYTVSKNPYAIFRTEMDIQHIVRVFEFTWGENSWHPHIHALFWAPTSKFKNFTQYEESLNKFWWKCLHKAITKNADVDFADELCSKKRQTHNGITISKEKDGSPRVQKSSFYVAGWQGSKWSADKELTRLEQKTTKDGHYTPFQMLTFAEEAEKNNDLDKKNFWLNLFLEYTLTTVKRRRCNFSPNCGKIIRKWKLTEAYMEVVKKKLTDRVAENWKVVYWFTEKQWLLICLIETTLNIPLRSQILKESARAPDKETFELFLTQIDKSLINHKQHKRIKEVESNIYGGIDSDLKERIKNIA